MRLPFSLRAGIFILALPLGTVACADCDHFESRGADVRVQLSPPDAEVEQFFGISVEEIRGLDFRMVRYSVSGSNLRWHVRGVKLLESTGERRLLFDFVPETPGPDPDDAGHGQASDTDLKVGTWEQFLVLLETHGVVAELTTDVEGMERLYLPMNAPNATEWIRAPCPTD